jgi:hypothetical protein
MRITLMVSQIPASPDAISLVGIFNTPTLFGGGGSMPLQLESNFFREELTSVIGLAF